MTRPILWATGALIAIGLSGGAAGTRLAGAFDWATAPAPPEPAPATASAIPAERVVQIDGDLRGHFIVHPWVDGRRTTMLVDTGASIVALTSEDAEAAGFRPSRSDYNRQIGTANGVVAVAPIRIRELRVGDISVRDVEAVVVPAGRLGTSLLGMSFLRRLPGFDISRGRLTLRG